MSITSSVNPHVINSNGPLTVHNRWEAELEDPIGIQVAQIALKNL